jgi:hypothetical protein
MNQNFVWKDGDFEHADEPDEKSPRSHRITISRFYVRKLDGFSTSKCTFNFLGERRLAKIRSIGRQKELQRLRRFKNKRSASLIVICGRRRIGKSRSIEEFPQFHLFSGLPPEVKVTEETRRQDFITQIQQQQTTPT